jgi:hypothetical protein
MVMCGHAGDDLLLVGKSAAVQETQTRRTAYHNPTHPLVSSTV